MCQEFRPHCLEQRQCVVRTSRVHRLSECIIYGFVQPTYLYIHLVPIQTVRVLLPRQSTGRGV